MSMFAAASPAVSLVAEPLVNVGPFLFTNSTLLGVFGTTTLLFVLFYAKSRIKSGRHNRFSIAILWAFESLFKTTEEVLGDREQAKKLAPLAVTMFFFILINNWFGLLPFVGPVTYHGHPLFRGLAADLNVTLALAIITMVTAQIWAARTLGIRGNLGRYFVNPFKNFMGFFTGILEIVAELSRLIALSMRLFGNVFGGEVLLGVIAFITLYFSPVALPVFMLLELFVGAIQAYVFFMLTVVFVSLGTMHHGDTHDAGVKKPSSVPMTAGTQ